MRMRGLLIAAVVLAALAGGLWWSNKSEDAKAKNPSPAADAPPKILSVPADQFQKIDIRKAGGEALSLERKPIKWEMTAPKPLPADQVAMESMVTTLASLASDRVVEEKAADLSQFGLAKPSMELTVTKKDGKSQQVAIGDETPTGGSYYAALKGDPRVFTVASFVKSAVDKTPNDLRDKRLLTFDVSKLTRVELAAKGPAIEFGKDNQNEWRILKPKPLRADGGQVETLIQKLQEARMELGATEEDTKKVAAGFASAAPLAVVKVSDASGEQQLQIRRDKDKNCFAKSTVAEGVYKTGADLGDALDKGLDDFRNKKVFDFGWMDPSKIEVRDGTKQSAYEKSGDKWMSGGKAMDSTTMQTVVDKLRDLSAAKFPEKGFTTPALEFTIVSNNGKRIEKVALSKSGADWIGKRENEPTLYQLDAKVVDELQKALGGVKEAAPPPKKK